MTKAYSKAAKLRLKKAMAEIPDLASTPRRKKRGKARMAEIAPDREPLEARARQMGKDKSILRRTKSGEAIIGYSEAVIAEMRDAMLSDDAGRAISIICAPDEAKQLWALYVALTACEARYHRSIGLSVHAKSAKIEMMPSTLETRADDRPDLRTQDEKDRDAQTAWMRWHGRIMCLPSSMQSDIWAIVRHRKDAQVDGKATRAGTRFVVAMRALPE